METPMSTGVRGRTAEGPMSHLGKAVFACKITELALASTCMGLYVYAPPIPLNEAIVIHVALGAYIILTSGMVMGHLLGERLPQKIDLFYTITGIFIFVAAGEVAERHYIDCIYEKDSKILDGLVGTGSWIIALVLFGDSVLVYKYVPMEPDGLT